MLYWLFSHCSRYACQQLPQTHVTANRAVWSRSSQDDVAFDGFCGNWNGNFGAKAKLPLTARQIQSLQMRAFPNKTVGLPAAIQRNSYVTQKACQAEAPAQDFQSACTRMLSMSIHRYLHALLKWKPVGKTGIRQGWSGPKVLPSLALILTQFFSFWAQGSF